MPPVTLVFIAALLTGLKLFDKISKHAGAGTLVPITSFGHSLIHGALDKAHDSGILGLLGGMFSLTSTGIVAAIIFGFIFTLIFKAKD